MSGSLDMDVAWVQPEILDIAWTLSTQDAALEAAAGTRGDFLNGPINPYKSHKHIWSFWSGSVSNPRPPNLNVSMRVFGGLIISSYFVHWS